MQASAAEAHDEVIAFLTASTDARRSCTTRSAARPVKVAQARTRKTA
ncbi:hypothetical protein ABZT02_35485 [Streptomyces sp. NPDC005402]